MAKELMINDIMSGETVYIDPEAMLIDYNASSEYCMVVSTTTECKKKLDDKHTLGIRLSAYGPWFEVVSDVDNEVTFREVAIRKKGLQQWNIVGYHRNNREGFKATYLNVILESDLS